MERRTAFFMGFTPLSLSPYNLTPRQCQGVFANFCRNFLLIFFSAFCYAPVYIPDPSSRMENSTTRGYLVWLSSPRQAWNTRR